MSVLEIDLNNGVKMPQLGLGVYKIHEGQQILDTVTCALGAGYRGIDTASLYGNERGVGEAVRRSGLDRSNVFVTTKVWNADQGYDCTLKAFEVSLRRLEMDYVDLYLIHWPVKRRFRDTWRALERLYQQKAVRAIGVCNFQVHHLEEILGSADVVPAINQVELHPMLTQVELRKYCQDKRIAVEAWSPLMRGGEVLNHPVITNLATKHGKSAAQIVLRWHIQSGLIVIPKSVTPDRIRENIDIFDFELGPEEMKQIDGLNADKRTGPDPDTF